MQQSLEVVRVRTHNDRAFLANINGQKMEYMDPEAESVKRQIEQQHAAQDKAREKMKQVLEVKADGG